MDWTVVAGLIGLIIVVAVVRSIGNQSAAPAEELPYVTKGSLLTKAERSFFGVLEQAVGSDLRVFAKVRVADVIAPKQGLARGDWQSAFNKISAKHFDFVLCDPASLNVRAVVELNDSSHKRTGRADRDEFLRSACAYAQVPLIEFTTKRGYSVDALRTDLAGI